MAHDPKPQGKPETPETATQPAPRNVPVRTALKAGADDPQTSWSAWLNRYNDSPNS